MASHTASTDQSLAVQRRTIAVFAAWAGVYLVLATVHGWLALVAQRGCTCRRESFDGALGATVLLEVLFSLSLLLYIAGPDSPRSPGGKCLFAFAGGTLGLEAAVLVLLCRVPEPKPADVSFGVFALFRLGFGVGFVGDPLAGAVDRFLAARKLPAAK